MAQDVNPFESFQAQVHEAGKRVGLDDGQLARLKNPERILETNLTVEMGRVNRGDPGISFPVQQ
jgi:glutamate dehydrogenase/leucine dehydrogenase